MKIAVLGTAPTSRDLAPFADPSWQIWACSPGNRGGVLPRVDLWFEVHSPEEMKLKKNWDAWAREYFLWLAQQPFPVVMQEKNDLVPRALVYPIHEVIAHFKTRNWFTSSPAYMMALIIMRMEQRMKTHPDEEMEIGIFGVDMAADQEAYSYQKPGCVYWIEKAQALGIKVFIPVESCLGVAIPMYAYADNTHFLRRLWAVRDMVLPQRNAMVAQMNDLQQRIAFFNGALEQLTYFERTWADGGDYVASLKAVEDKVAEAAAINVEPATSTVPASAGPAQGAGGEPAAAVPETRSPATSPVRLVANEGG